MGPLGRRFFINTRLNVGWSDSERQSVVETPTVRVLDAQTLGGAQKSGGRHSRDVNFATDLDYVRGIHSVRVGTAIDANWFRSDESDNYLGTYTFESLDAFDAGRPRSYTRRIGDPNVSYFNLQSAVYIQDDIRLRRSLSVTPGVRVETQTHIKGVVAGPRIGATWAPFKDGKTTPAGELGHVSTTGCRPTRTSSPFASTGSGSAKSTSRIPPIRAAVDRCRCGPRRIAIFSIPALKHPRNSRVSGGVDYAFSPRYRVNATYRYTRGEGLFRGAQPESAGQRPSAIAGVDRSSEM